MNKFLIIVISFWLSPYILAQKVTTLSWTDFEISEYKKVEIDFMGMKDSVEWPVFSKHLQELDGKKVILEGYFLCMETVVDIMDTNMTEVCMITIAKEPTIQICGVPQFRHTELALINNNMKASMGEKIKIRGVLRLNQNGDDGSLIQIEKSKIITK